jgi:cobalt/nickel transport system permease protein
MYLPSPPAIVNTAPPALHIPDGFLSLPVSVGGYVVTGIALAYALRRTGRELGERQIPLMGVMAAFVFAAQMLNFPIPGGTSGHLVGSALLAILLGPWAAMLVLSCVLALQALLFQDGGLLVMGVNIFNMGVLGTLSAYLVFTVIHWLSGRGAWGFMAGAAVAAWFSVVIMAVAVALQLAFSGTTSLAVALLAMGGVHALIGLGEGAITLGALAFIRALRRDLLEARPYGGGGRI